MMRISKKYWCNFLFLFCFVFTPAWGSSASEDFIKLLSVEEKQWLSEHRHIKIAIDKGWAPIEFVTESGDYSGISKDYIGAGDKSPSVIISDL